jgi:phosphoribosylamine--glycine ligase
MEWGKGHMNNRVLVIGGGGREHAICWKLSQSMHVNKIFCAPGNAGICEIAECLDLDIMNNEQLVEFAKKNDINLTIVGPEAPLVNGICDEFVKHNLKIFGPKKFAAMLEGSKVFSKRIMQKYNIPTARSEIFNEYKSAIRFIESNPWVRVVKADGLAAGKGVYVCDTAEEAINAVHDIMIKRLFGKSGNRVIFEERLIGEEASFLAFSDGKTIKPMISSQDHKAVYDNDLGPNTGGMGAYAHAPIMTEQLENEVMDKVMMRIVKAMKEEGSPYIGVLYAGLMITKHGPKVLEFNCRFGDPEAQPILMLMESDLYEVIVACLESKLNITDIKFKDKSSCCVIMASGGYPGKYEKGKKIHGLEKTRELQNVKVFHSGTRKSDEDILTNGGRVLGVTGVGTTISEAIDNAYRGVKEISFENHYYRKDIGQKAVRKAK